MLSKKIIWAGVAGIFLLSGCASQPKAVKKDAPVPLTKLEAAAQSVQVAMDNLVAAEAAKNAKAKYTPSKAPEGLNSMIAIKWNGTLTNLLNHLKPAYKGYTLSVFGKEPAIPVIVNIQSENISVFDVIKDAGLQAGDRASIVIDTKDKANKKIELRYPS